jgi:basic membrane protein A
VLAEKDAIVSGKKVVWSGPIVRQDGKPGAAPGEKLSQPAIETMDYLVKGVIGSAK